jgi:hypothetical protein
MLGPGFYTCYGNLAGEGSDGLQAGALVGNGDRIGRDSPCRAPVHFQILTGWLEISGTVPRVCESRNRDVRVFFNTCRQEYC